MSRDGSEDRPLNILFVDHNECVADTPAKIFDLHGSTTAAVYDSMEALQQVRGRTPKCVVCNGAMREPNGIELAMRVHGEFPNCVIVLLRGGSWLDDILDDAQAKGYHLTLDAYPIHPLELMKQLCAHSIIPDKPPQMEWSHS